MHKITNPDITTKSGNCSVCGPVKARVRLYKGKTTFQCMNRITVARRIWHLKNKHRQRQYNFKRRHNLSIIPDTAPSKCDVCGEPNRRICYDHDHQTDEFRGWLCSNCNLILGLAKDDPKVLQDLIDYLNKNRKSVI